MSEIHVKKYSNTLKAIILHLFYILLTILSRQHIFLLSYIYTPMDKSIENRIFDLLALKLSGGATSKELGQLQELLQQYPDFQFTYDQIMKPRATDVSEEHTHQAYAGHFAKKIVFNATNLGNAQYEKGFTKHSKRFSIMKYAAIAASIAGIILFYQLFSGDSKRKNSNKNARFNEMTTQKASKSTLTLPDGTTVVLNADSKITYDEKFLGTNREVTLTGEAFFDVRHDAEHPFIIHTGKADIKVLGTTFNVRNYPQDAIFETSLIKGRIEVTINDVSHRKIILVPSQKLTISPVVEKAVTKPAKISPTVDIVKVSPITVQDNVLVETSWMNNKLIFVNKPLVEIARELERHFNVQVIFNSDKAKNYCYTGTYENQSLEDIMKILKLSKTINYKLKNNELIIE